RWRVPDERVHVLVSDSIKPQADRYVEFFEQRFDAADAQAGAVLDLVATEYDADRGLDAEGLDFSEPFVERAREYARERGVADRAAVHEHDLRDLDEWTGSYDLVTSFWNSLGYYDRETDERMLANARRLLGEEGVLVVEASNRDFYLANLERSSVSEDEDLFVVLATP
ncbi:MAG: class I SAM-dependent methyltransferase, partial [Haloarculaceae archaeon]